MLDARTFHRLAAASRQFLARPAAPWFIGFTGFFTTALTQFALTLAGAPATPLSALMQSFGAQSVGAAAILTTAQYAATRVDRTITAPYTQFNVMLVAPDFDRRAVWTAVAVRPSGSGVVLPFVSHEADALTTFLDAASRTARILPESLPTDTMVPADHDLDWDTIRSTAFSPHLVLFRPNASADAPSSFWFVPTTAPCAVPDGSDTARVAQIGVTPLGRTVRFLSVSGTWLYGGESTPTAAFPLAKAQRTAMHLARVQAFAPRAAQEPVPPALAFAYLDRLSPNGSVKPTTLPVQWTRPVPAPPGPPGVFLASVPTPDGPRWTAWRRTRAGLAQALTEPDGRPALAPDPAAVTRRLLAQGLVPTALAPWPPVLTPRAGPARPAVTVAPAPRR
jgi:hypothetical protein